MFKNVGGCFFEDKIIWGVISVFSLFLLSCSFYFQHIMLLEPCVLCIYQRLSVIGILIVSSMMFFFNPVSKFIRIIGSLTTFLISFFGSYNAILQWRENYLADTNPFFFPQCGKGLEQFFPSIENSEFLSNILLARGICSEIDWEFLGLGMHHYMTFIFSGLALVSFIYIIFIFINKKQ